MEGTSCVKSRTSQISANAVRLSSRSLKPDGIQLIRIKIFIACLYRAATPSSSHHEAIERVTMRLHAWVSLVLLQLSACVALREATGRLTDSAKALVDSPANEASKTPVLSKRAPQVSSNSGSDPVASHDSPSEARSFMPSLHDFAYKVAGMLDVSPTILYRLFRLKNANENLSESVRLNKWFKYTLKHQYKNGRTRYSDSKIYDLLSKSKTDDQLVALFLKMRDSKTTQQFATNMLAFMLDRPGTKSATYEALLRLEQNPLHVYTLIGKSGLDLRVEAFRDWLQYTDSYRQSVAHVSKTDFIENQKFLYPIFDMLRTETKNIGDLVDLFDYARARADIATIGGELKIIAEQEREIATALGLPKPLSPAEFAGSVNLVASKNDRFCQWLRYCQSYKTVARDEDGMVVLDESVSQMVLDVMDKMTPIDKFVPLLQSVREAPRLQLFVDFLVQAAKREQQNRLWLMEKRSPGEVFEALIKKKKDHTVQWFRYLMLYENKHGLAVILKDLLSSMYPPGTSYNIVDLAVFFELLKQVVDIRPIVSRLQTEVFDSIWRMKATPEQLFEHEKTFGSFYRKADIAITIEKYRLYCIIRQQGIKK